MTLICQQEPEWKRERVQSSRSALAFFSNTEKFAREKFVVVGLLQSLGIKFDDPELMKADGPGDVKFRDALFQVKELMETGRRRSATPSA